jgi:hypothetical protein
MAIQEKPRARLESAWIKGSGADEIFRGALLMEGRAVT